MFVVKINLFGSILKVVGLVENFVNVGLNKIDMVVLFGGYMIG